MSKEKSFLLLILLIAFFFRFYNFQHLQYWSGDEEIASAVVRRMIYVQKPTLISPSLAVGALGSFFHLLSVPVFLASSQNPIKILLFMSLLGVVTTYLIYKCGKLLLNSRLGLIASFIYASSFVLALFDRRWWPLSLNPLMATLALIALFQIVVNKKYIYSILLAVTIGFAGHADPTITVVAVATALVLIFLRVPLKRKEYLWAAVTLLIFMSPLILFEIRHPGALIKPIVKNLQNVSSREAERSSDIYLFNPISPIARTLFPKESNFAEKHFCYCPTEGLTLLPAITGILIVLFLVYPLYSLKRIKNTPEKSTLKILYLFLASFLIGMVVYVTVYGYRFNEHYFTIIFPVTTLIIAYSITHIFKNQKALILVLAALFLINLKALLFSTLKYPLYDKYNIVKAAGRYLGFHDFSLYAIGGGGYLHGGGLTGLFVLNEKHPKKSYIYPFYDWMYKAFSLYTVEPQAKDQEKIVLIGDIHSFNKHFDNLEFNKEEGNLKVYILDNSQGNFEEESLSNFEQN